LAKGAQAKVVITLKAAATGQLVNQASAHAAPVDVVRANNASALTVKANP